MSIWENSDNIGYQFSNENCIDVQGAPGITTGSNNVYNVHTANYWNNQITLSIVTYAHWWYAVLYCLYNVDDFSVYSIISDLQEN